jgi:hypothetical protein
MVAKIRCVCGEQERFEGKLSEWRCGSCGLDWEGQAQGTTRQQGKAQQADSAATQPMPGRIPGHTQDWATESPLYGGQVHPPPRDLDLHRRLGPVQQYDDDT